MTGGLPSGWWLGVLRASWSGQDECAAANRHDVGSLIRGPADIVESLVTFHGDVVNAAGDYKNIRFWGVVKTVSRYDEMTFPRAHDRKFARHGVEVECIPGGFSGPACHAIDGREEL